jgi:hypothetical protein
MRGKLIAIAWLMLSSCAEDSGDPPGEPGSTCSNGKLDGDETDVDCGGSTCGKCPGGRTCATAADCFSNNCVESSSTCFGMELSFAAPVSYASDLKPYAIATGDFDRDGDIDIAVVNELDSTVLIFRNDGTGVFQRQEVGVKTAEYPTGTAVADFNHDGIDDFVTADYHGNSVSVMLGSGQGTEYALSPSTSYPTVAGAETSTLAVGDLDGDGNIDVVAANPQAHSISVFLGRADGTLRSGTTIPVGMPDSEPYSVAIADYDSDGVADIAVADNRSTTVILQHGNGDGTFTVDPVQPMIGGGASFIMIARDMDQDGQLDLVVSNRGSDSVSILRSRGDGTFREPFVAELDMMSGPYSVAVADFNLDGVPDVVTANFIAGITTVFLGTGNGGLEAPMDAGATGESSYGVAVGDFNGDGKPDFAVANATTNMMVVVMNTAN